MTHRCKYLRLQYCILIYYIYEVDEDSFLFFQYHFSYKIFTFVCLSCQDGCNYLHAAIKSGEVECVEVLLQHVLATDDGLHLLHWLAGGPDHQGITPLALAVASPTADLLAALGHAGLDIPALLSHDPSLLKLSSSACLTLLSSSSELQG